jgi:3-keto-disaccharide hydrolase
MKLRLTLALLWITAGLLRADAPKEFILFDGKSLDDWQSVDAGGSGKVTLDDGQMIINTGESVTGAIYKKADQLPLTNYEITLEAMRTDGSDFFCGLTFPVGSLKTCATFILGGWGGAVTGISSIDGADASENATGHYRKLDDKKWYRIKLRVTPENLSVWVNDAKAVDVDIKGRKIGLRPGPIEEYAPLSLTTYQTTAAIRNVKLTPIVEAKK